MPVAQLDLHRAVAVGAPDAYAARAQRVDHRGVRMAEDVVPPAGDQGHARADLVEERLPWCAIFSTVARPRRGAISLSASRSMSPVSRICSFSSPICTTTEALFSGARRKVRSATKARRSIAPRRRA